MHSLPTSLAITKLHDLEHVQVPIVELPVNYGPLKEHIKKFCKAFLSIKS